MSKSADSYLEIPAGQAVFAEGDAGQAMYIIESGSIELMLASRGAEAIATLGPGEFFGEMSMFDEQPRFSSAVARQPTRLLRIERGDFADLLRQDIEIAISLLRKLGQRHQQCELRLTSMLAEHEGKKRKPDAASSRQTVAAEPPARAAPTRPAAKAPLESRTTIEPPKASPPAARLRGGCVLKHAKGQVFTLDPALNEFLVGRPDPGAGIQPQIDLSDVDPTRSLSRRHAKLVRQGQLFFVREEGRTVNGTFVNNVRIGTGVDVPLKPGDTLRFGAVEVEFSAA